jgi:hypothetical protein
MNKLLNFAVTAALSAILGFAAVGCNDGGGVVNSEREAALNSTGESGSPNTNGDKRPDDISGKGCDIVSECPDGFEGNQVVVGIDPDPVPPAGKDTTYYKPVVTDTVKHPTDPKPVVKDTSGHVNGNFQAVPFTEYSVRCGTSKTATQEWVNLNEIYVINSFEEFLSLNRCPGLMRDQFTDIDFSTSTLLFVAGRASNGISSIEKSLSKSENQYGLDIVLWLNDTEEAPVWDVGLVVDKLSPESAVRFYVKDMRAFR